MTRKADNSDERHGQWGNAGKSDVKLTPKERAEITRRFEEYTAEGFTWGDAMPVEWQGTIWLSKLVKRRESCLVVSEDGTGKGSATSLLENIDGLVVLPCPRDTDEIYQLLWTEMEDKDGHRPLPDWRTFLDTKKRDYWHCTRCKRHCKLVHSSWLDVKPDPDDISDGLFRVEGSCPLREAEVERNVELLRGLIIALRLPEVNDKIIDLLKIIITIATLVLLVNTEQRRVLCKQLTFRRLPYYSFPKPTAQFVLELAEEFCAQKIVTPEALWLIALLSNDNPGVFVRNLKLINSESELAELTTPAAPAFVAEKLRLVINPETALQIISANKSGWVPVEEIYNDLQNFNICLSSESIGKRLTKMGLTGRKVPTAEYYFTQSFPQLTNGSNGTKGLLEAESPESKLKLLIK